MASDLRDKILGNVHLKEETIKVPEWGVEVVCKELTGAQRAKIENDTINPQTGQVNLNKLYSMVIIAGTYDGEGKKVFEPTDRDAIMAGSGAAVTRVATKIMTLSGWSESEIKDMEKN